MIAQKSKNAWKKKPFNSAYCEHCKATTHTTTNCWFLFLDKAPKGFTPRRQNNTNSSLNSKMKNYRVEKPKSQKSSIKRDENAETALISIDDFNQQEEAKNEDTILPDFSTLSEDEFDMAEEVCLPLINNIKNAANKHKPDRLKRHRNEDFTMSETKKDYTPGLMFNFILDTAATIHTICNLDYFY
jgi:hypothetical protein